MGAMPNRVHKYAQTYDRHGRHDTELEDMACRRLASVILLQAAADWITLLNHNAKYGDDKPRPYVSNIGTYTSIADFVRGSVLGQVCCAIVELEPETIVEKLWKWKATFDRTGKIPTQVYKAGVIDSTLNNAERCRQYRERMRKQKQHPPCRYDRQWEDTK